MAIIGANVVLPSVESFERAGLLAWPGIEVEWDGQWVRRSANGYTKRANSLQCLDPADAVNISERLAESVAWFKARRLPPVVRTTPLAAPALNAVLDRQGWAQIDASHQYAMALGDHEPDVEARIMAVLDSKFLDAQQQLQNYPEATVDGLRALLHAMAVPAAGIVVYRGTVPVASGLMAIADGIVVTGNVVVAPARRRQGLAAAMMNTGLHWAKSQGATVAALNVQADNAAAMALYQSLGYARQYDYSYRVPGTVDE